MPAQQGSIGQDIVVSDDTVVSDVGPGHQEIPVAQDGVFIESVRTVHGHVLSEDIVVADAQSGRLPGVFEVLRRISQHSSGMDAVSGAQLGMAREVGARAHLTVGPHDDVSVDDGMGTDLTAFSELSRRVDDRCRMDLGGHRRHQIRNPTTQAVM
jgi:hypothetical protein